MPMTLNLVSQPLPINEVGTCFTFVFTADDVFNNIEQNRMVYQLLDHTGQPLTYKEHYVPAEGLPFPLDFNEIIKRRVFTPAPPYQLSGSLVIPSMIRQIALKTEVYTYNKEECTDALTSESLIEGFQVLNVASDWTYPLVLDPGVILNKKPSIMYQHKQSNDWLYIYGSAEIKISFMDRTNTILGFQFITTAVDVITCVGIGWLNIIPTMPEFTQYYRVSVNDVHITSYVLECGQHETDLYFFDNGYSCLSLTRLTSGVNSSQSVVNQYNPVCDPLNNDNLIKKGLTIANKKSFHAVTLSKQIPYSNEDDLNYLRRALAAPQYYIQTYWLGVRRMIKFIVDPSQTQFEVTDNFANIEFSGYINRAIPQANGSY